MVDKHSIYSRIQLRYFRDILLRLLVSKVIIYS
jgi:hypothetical protein